MTDAATPADAPTGAPTDQPSDNTTLTEVLESYAASGYSTNFWAEADANVRCDSCQSVLPSRRLVMHSIRRLEGASDPADMAAVVATSCPVCGAEGTMVLSYGPTASEFDADVLLALSDRRDTPGLPQNAAPDETPDHGST
jgi:hypothetical protein